MTGDVLPMSYVATVAVTGRISDKQLRKAEAVRFDKAVPSRRPDFNSWEYKRLRASGMSLCNAMVPIRGALYDSMWSCYDLSVDGYSSNSTPFSQPFR